MGKNKQLRARLYGLREMIRLHLKKIEMELGRPSPDDGLIRHWKTEIAAWKRTAMKIELRLKKGK